MPEDLPTPNKSLKEIEKENLKLKEQIKAKKIANLIVKQWIK